MTFPTIAAGTRANEAIGGYANFVAYCNALAAGVDSVTTTAAGAALKANNLSDLASASTARTNLGLGTMATAAASDYLSKAGNLSGIADAAVARTNLGLGDAATRDVGTGVGTVAAGDDSRLTDARTPTDGSVSTVKIADGAVTDAKLASKKAPRTALWLPGTSENYASAPYVAALGITGNLDVRWCGSLDNRTPATYMSLVGRQLVAGNHVVFNLYVRLSTGLIAFLWSPDGTAGNSRTLISSASPPVLSKEIFSVRAQLVVDNGAGGATVSFDTRSDTDISASTGWTPLGVPQVSAGRSSVYVDASQPLEIGSIQNGATSPLAGRTLKAEVRNGINGTVVASPDFTAPVGPRSRDTQGNIWTINGSAWAWEQS